jgi:hypothetical protein
MNAASRRSADRAWTRICRRLDRDGDTISACQDIFDREAWWNQF